MGKMLSLEEQKSELLDILNHYTGRSFRVLPERGPTKLLKTFTLEEIESALSMLCADSWHRQRIKELSSEYLLRATTIDKWLQVAASAPKPNHLNEEPLAKI